MPGLRELLKKKDKIENETPPAQTANLNVPPEFTFMRTTTTQEEVIQPPDYPDQDWPDEKKKSKEKSKEHKHYLGFRKSSNANETKDPTAAAPTSDLSVRPKHERKLSDRLHISRQSRSPSADSSANLPKNLPDAPTAVGPVGPANQAAPEEKDANEQREAQWEKRATILAQSNPLLEQEQQRQNAQQEKPRSRSRSRSPSVSDKRGDENIQEAIRLHEIGELGLSTAMFGRLGDPKGQNNALAQVLYGLALRHGWGVPQEPEKAIHYLSLAASNSAAIEKAALESGLKKGGAAKGELVLAIYELANCFRHGWGVKKDAVAARQYYETAANLGDTDAMEEAANCYLEGLGGPKDKVRSNLSLWSPIVVLA
jgi:TPR repeat protein